MDKRTIAINTPYPHHDAYGSLSMPVYHTCAYEFATADMMTEAFTGRVLEPDYSRTMNPTVTHFEDRVKALTGATDVVAFNSGMAAISNTLLACSGAGKNIVTSRHLFGNTFALITKTLARYGVETRLVDMTNLDEVDAAIDANTACVFLEIITNPQLEVADLKALSQIAHSEKGGRASVPLVADTTMVPFTEFSAKDLGVDFELVSSTKYVSGGATSLGGLVISYGTFPEVTRAIKWELLFNLGAYMTPHAAYMQTLGLETLNARYRVQSANALELAQRLSAHPAIVRVNYPGLASCPGYELACQQYGKASALHATPGGAAISAMLTIDLDSRESCHRFIDRLQLIHRATNLFDNRTLAIHPASTIFANFSEEQRKAMDVLDTTVRISVGLECVDDLYDDILQAL